MVRYTYAMVPHHGERGPFYRLIRGNEGLFLVGAGSPENPATAWAALAWGGASLLLEEAEAWPEGAALSPFLVRRKYLLMAFSPPGQIELGRMAAQGRLTAAAREELGFRLVGMLTMAPTPGRWLNAFSHVVGYLPLPWRRER